MRFTLRCIVTWMLLGHTPVWANDGPSFDCSEAEGTVEQMICADSTLAALDVHLASVWDTVLVLARDNVDGDRIRAEQRGWIKGRNECWKSEDVRECVVTAYQRRTAELEARWKLVPVRGPYFFACDENPANEVVVRYFETDPPTAILERGDQSLVVFLEQAASGAMYRGRNVTFWTKGDEAMLTWGWEAPTLRCMRQAADQK